MVPFYRKWKTVARLVEILDLSDEMHNFQLTSDPFQIFNSDKIKAT